MRPPKSKNMSEWSKQQLDTVLNSKKSSKEDKEKVQAILTDRVEKGFIFLKKFFNQESNKFWNLAKWQLYREGKAKCYGVGVHQKFYIKDTSLIFDKMIEIKNKFDKYQKGKDETIKEFSEWKR